MVKPAEDTPLTALALANLAEQAGFPKGKKLRPFNFLRFLSLLMTSASHRF